MPHETPLISTIVAALVLAFVLGAIANRLRISPLVGYLLAGVAIGPFTPGYVADQGVAKDLAEIGVILLMFGVGLHFTLQDLLSVRAIAIPGALVQIASAAVLGLGLAWLLGWTVAAGLVFGLALSVASTVVLLRALQQRRLLETERGRIAVGWLVVEDFATILALVLLPALASVAKDSAGMSASDLILPVLVTLAKVAAFVAVMLIVGKRVIPLVMHYVAHTGSRELFRLAVLAIALGVAYGASRLFDVSFALGAFFAGIILAESELSQRAASEILPLRDAFAVLFFVSVGMLVNPAIVVNDPVALLATLLIVVLGKSIAAFAIVRAFGHSSSTALTISASLAQIGEFSFILAALGVGLGLLPARGQDLILATAIVSILLNPALFAGLDRLLARRESAAQGAEAAGARRAGGARADAADASARSRRAGRARPRRPHRGRRPQDPAGAAVPDRERRRQRRQTDGGRRRGDRRQRGRPGCDQRRQHRRRALSDGGDSRRLRGRAGSGAGARDQPGAPHHRPFTFRRGNCASQGARGHQGHHGRGGDRLGHAGRAGEVVIVM